MAAVLSHESWADYVTEVNMAKTGLNVTEFLDDLQEKLRPIAEHELHTLRALKADDLARRNLEPEETFYIWDYRFYHHMHVAQKLDLDPNVIKDYFLVSNTVFAMLQIYQDLLGVRFIRATKEQAEVWHEDVEVYAVWDKDEMESEAFIGWCYLDLFSRSFKFGHAAVFLVCWAYTRSDGSRQHPAVALVANIAKATDRPSLMLHEEVVTIFHELGHAFHGLLSRTRHVRFHGTQVAQDFVEAPSQMLENWCWEPQVLVRISQHYSTGESLPSELIKKVVKSRYVNSGLHYLRQLFLAKFDMAIHSAHSNPTMTTDYARLYNDLRVRISFMPGRKEVSGHAAFAHLMSGYDAGYYGYVYSEVFAADMYKTVFGSDLFDSSKGDHYRRTILLPGASRDEMDSLKEFLGRLPTPDAFAEFLLRPT